MLKASVLTLALAIPAWAGDMGYPIAPPNGRTASTEPAKTSEIGCPLATNVAVTLLQNLLMLF
jgi:hypothetical protein